jgi:hypothetical protein
MVRTKTRRSPGVATATMIALPSFLNHTTVVAFSSSASFDAAAICASSVFSSLPSCVTVSTSRSTIWPARRASTRSSPLPASRTTTRSGSAATTPGAARTTAITSKRAGFTPPRLRHEEQEDQEQEAVHAAKEHVIDVIGSR